MSAARLDDRTRGEAAAWFSALRRGLMSLEEREAFDAWRADPTNQAALNHMHELWGEVSAIKELGVTAPPPKSRAARIAGPASALLLAVAVGVGGAWWLGRPDRVRTGVGEQRTATLEDGSVVALNVVTRIEYEMEPDVRAVSLPEGEAVFFVRKDPARPFLVTAGGYEIRAVGTAFNVRHRDGVVAVAVSEGVVAVKALTGPDAGREIARLPAGRQLRLGEGASAPAPVAAESVAQWRVRVIDYEDASVAAVVADLNRFFERPVQVDDAALAGRRVTLRLQIEDRERTLRNLGEMLGADLRARGGADLLVPRA